MIGTIILFFVVLSVLVLAHEWGHYYTAKKLGAKVEEFGLGFPPKVFSWKGKDGMEWSLNAIPVGGFVRIKGESGEHKDEPDSFATKSIPARLLILSAGVIMNMVVAVVLFTTTALVGMPAVTEFGVPESATVLERTVRVVEVASETPAEGSFEPGDAIVSLNGSDVQTSEELRTAIASLPAGEEAVFGVQRRTEYLDVTVAPEEIEDRSMIGFALLETGIVRYPWYQAPVKGVETTFVFTRDILVGFYQLIRGLFVPADRIDAELAGPVGIAVMTGEVASLGFAYLLQFAALLSINLAILNILPIPALDGGRIVFVLIEAVRRKPVSQEVEGIVHGLGFLLLMGLVVVVTFKDIVNLL